MVKGAIFWLSFAAAIYAADPASEYVGSKVCFGCHAAIYRSYTQTAMGRSLTQANTLDHLNIPADASLTTVDGRVVRVGRDSAEGWFQSEEQPGVFTDKHALAYLVGSGANGFTFLIRRDNGLFQAPLSYYSKPGKWDFSPGYEYADVGFSRSVTTDCLNCHSGRALPVAGQSAVYAEPVFSELAIGCENCHGPGGLHVQNPQRAGATVNPGKLPPRLAENICMNCHQGGDSRVVQPGKQLQNFRPGQWLVDTVAIFKASKRTDEERNADLLEHNAAMQLSRCFRESAGKLSCLTCHDPHVQPQRVQGAAYFRNKCLTCHTDASCRLPKPQRLAQADNCIGCHMPKRNVRVISHSALTNHRIPAREEEPLPPETPQTSDIVLIDAPVGQPYTIPGVTLLSAYADLAARKPEYQQAYLDLLDKLTNTEPREPFVEAALGHRLLTEGKNEEALAHLSRATALNDLAVYQDTAKAAENLGRENDALTALQAAAHAFPFDGVVLKSLTLEYIKTKRYPEAREEMQEYVGLFPQDGFMRGLLARVSQ